MFSTLLKAGLSALMSILAGVGVGEIMDKVAADKVPSYSNPYKEGGSLNPMKIVWIAALTFVGVLLAKKLQKVFKIKIF